MKVVILVGGEATRLRPLTYNMPKAVVPVLNIPFLEHVVRYLSQHQIKDIILAQSRLAQSIENYFGDGSQFGVRLYYSIESTPLGTAGAVKNAEEYLDDAFLVLNGDIFTDLDITSMIGFHREKKAKATIVLTPVEDPTHYGLIETNDQNRITRFLEKPEPSQITTNMINAGTYVLEPEILSLIPAQTSVSIERETFPLLLECDEPVYAYPSDAYWIDIGTADKYFQLHRDLLTGRSSQCMFPGDTGVVIGEQSSIQPTAQITGPVLIGNNCSIGRWVKLIGPVVIGGGCKILEDTAIEEAIVWRNVQIGERVNLKNSIVADNCRLDTDCIIEDSVLGDSVTVVSGCRLEPGSRIEPGTVVGAPLL